MDRRGFIGSILALGVAPAIVRADSLMRIVPRETGVIVRGFATGDIILDMSGNGNHLIMTVLVYNTAHGEEAKNKVFKWMGSNLTAPPKPNELVGWWKA